MSKDLSWGRTLGARLGGITVVLLVVSALLVVGNFWTLASMRGDAASLALYAKGRALCNALLYHSQELAATDGEGQKSLRSQLEGVMQEMEERQEVLARGDVLQDIPAVTDSNLVAGMRDRNRRWAEQVKPVLQRILKAPTRQEVEKELPELKKLIASWYASLEEGVKQFQSLLRAKVERFQLFLYVFTVLVLAVLAALVWIGAGIVRRTRRLAETADRIAAGELELNANVGGADELAALGQAFDAMTGNLRQTIETEKGRRAQIEKLLESIREAAF